jgi:hypothetical protein
MHLNANTGIQTREKMSLKATVLYPLLNSPVTRTANKRKRALKESNDKFLKYHQKYLR